MEKRVGVTVDPLTISQEELLTLLGELQVNCVNIRIEFWKKENIEKILSVVYFLHSQNFSIILTLLQNRDAVRNINVWEDFTFIVFSKFKDFCEVFQIGHAPNRIKWGIWDFREYGVLYEIAHRVAQNFDGVKLLAPSVIDFEWFFLNAILKKIKKNPPFAVSHLLHTDTRIKPEYGSCEFNIWKKVCFLKSIMEVHLSPSTPLWITEVNWPLKGYGEYAPAGGKAQVDEEEYANYIIRYFILTLCTGYVERIYWFQLVAAGYGLVDSLSGLRRRPAFYAFKTFVKNIGESQFIKNLSQDDIYKFVFKISDDLFVMVCWTKEGQKIMSLPEGCYQVILRDGDVLNVQQKDINITESPVYIYCRKVKL